MKSNHCGEWKNELSAFCDSHMNLLLNDFYFNALKDSVLEKKTSGSFEG
jgi:hypothetical protein